MGIFNATATYGRGFKPTKNPNEFSLKVYLGGFAGGGTADQRANEEIEAYKKKNGYTKHEIVSRKNHFLFLRYFGYIVRFSR